MAATAAIHASSGWGMKAASCVDSRLRGNDDWGLAPERDAPADPRSSALPCRGGLFSRGPQGCLIDRLRVHIGAIEHGESRVTPLERKEEIGPSEQNDLGALLPA